MYTVDMDKLSVASEQELHSLEGKAISQLQKALAKENQLFSMDIRMIPPLPPWNSCSVA